MYLVARGTGSSARASSRSWETLAVGLCQVRVGAAQQRRGGPVAAAGDHEGARHGLRREQQKPYCGHEARRGSHGGGSGGASRAVARGAAARGSHARCGP
ncbi:unnamed protein product [Prorocentrum cordatum]|uniref:Uncharacterized protein n=1 Tax=Prorocentrum cordatum TaxID=2364126 RepID=A0ABN9SP66_9DINO|nr:unnamed protein product [Polarella glacialis]